MSDLRTTWTEIKVVLKENEQAVEMIKHAISQLLRKERKR